MMILSGLQINNMLEVLSFIAIGILLGTITGLTPGLHMNTIALIGFAIFPFLGITPLEFATAMVSMAVTQSFLDFIPSIFLGAPEEDTALSILPAHRLLLQGKAIEAVELTAYGSFFGVAFAVILLFPAILLIPIVYSYIHPLIAYILIFAVIFLILLEKKKAKIFYASAVFLLSGFLGMIAFDSALLSDTEILFPLFAGLFGISNILASLIGNERNKRVPQDEFVRVRVDSDLLRSSFVGTICGMIVGVLPSMSPSQVGTLAYTFTRNNIRNFLTTISAINTSDAIFSFVSIYTINNARSGVAVMTGKIISVDFNTLIYLVGVIAFAVLFVTFFHIKIGILMTSIVEKINYTLLALFSLFLMLLLILVFTGPYGLFIATISTIIGVIPIYVGVSRTHNMGVLIIPTILYFI